MVLSVTWPPNISNITELFTSSLWNENNDKNFRPTIRTTEGEISGLKEPFNILQIYNQIYCAC